MFSIDLLCTGFVPNIMVSHFKLSLFRNCLLHTLGLILYINDTAFVSSPTSARDTQRHGAFRTLSAGNELLATLG